MIGKEKDEWEVKEGRRRIRRMFTQEGTNPLE